MHIRAIRGRLFAFWRAMEVFRTSAVRRRFGKYPHCDHFTRKDLELSPIPAIRLSGNASLCGRIKPIAVSLGSEFP
jgi:hypothetical protein